MEVAKLASENTFDETKIEKYLKNKIQINITLFVFRKSQVVQVGDDQSKKID